MQNILHFSICKILCYSGRPWRQTLNGKEYVFWVFSFTPTPPAALHIDILLRGFHSFSNLSWGRLCGRYCARHWGHEDTCQLYLDRSQPFITTRSWRVIGLNVPIKVSVLPRYRHTYIGAGNKLSVLSMHQLPSLTSECSQSSLRCLCYSALLLFCITQAQGGVWP